MKYRAVKTFILEKLDKELSGNLTYHGKHHTLDVLKVTTWLCEVEKIPAYEATLLQTAALFHDSGFTINRRNHEILGCKIAEHTLPNFGYSQREIERICSMIMATKIPQNPQNYLEKILCDADLDYLGREDFFDIGDTLFQELKEFDVIQSEKEWYQIQVDFLEKHSFFTETNKKVRELKKKQHLRQLKWTLESYKLEKR